MSARMENILHFHSIFNSRPYCTTHITWLPFGHSRRRIDRFRRSFANPRRSSLGNGVKMEDEDLVLSTKQTSFLDCVSSFTFTTLNLYLIGSHNNRDLKKILIYQPRSIAMSISSNDKNLKKKWKWNYKWNEYHLYLIGGEYQWQRESAALQAE